MGVEGGMARVSSWFHTLIYNFLYSRDKNKDFYWVNQERWSSYPCCLA